MPFSDVWFFVTGADLLESQQAGIKLFGSVVLGNPGAPELNNDTPQDCFYLNFGTALFDLRIMGTLFCPNVQKLPCLSALFRLHDRV